MGVRETVARFLEEAGLSAESRVAVACSGGPDSVALADAALALASEGRLGPVTLVYVDHGLRAEAAGEAERVRDLAASGGGDARVVPAAIDRRRSSLEGAAREARYAALERLAEELEPEAVLLAHTASDQAETVLMRVLTGTGVAGLAGIPPRRGRYLRPLLGVTRAEVERYLEARGLSASRDPMNRDLRFFRNRVRARWLPALAEENPQLEAALCRLAEAAREQRAVLEDAAEALLARAASPGAPGDLAVEVLAGAPAATAKRALALAAERAGGGPLSAVHQEALYELVRRPESGTVALDLPGIRAERVYGRLQLGEAAPRADGGALEVAGPDGPYDVRRWRAGDRMRPPRLKGRSRKLSDLYVDAKIPRRLRERARVVVRRADGAVVWAEHLGPAHGSAVSVTLTAIDPAATKEY